MDNAEEWQFITCDREKMGDWLTETRRGTTTSRSSNRPNSRGMTPSSNENATVHFKTYTEEEKIKIIVSKRNEITNSINKSKLD